MPMPGSDCSTTSGSSSRRSAPGRSLDESLRRGTAVGPRRRAAARRSRAPSHANRPGGGPAARHLDVARDHAASARTRRSTGRRRRTPRASRCSAPEPHQAEQHDATAIRMRRSTSTPYGVPFTNVTRGTNFSVSDRGGPELDQPDREQRGDDDERDERRPGASRGRAGGEFGRRHALLPGRGAQQRRAGRTRSRRVKDAQ